MQKTYGKIAWSILYTIIASLIFILGLNLLQVIPEELRDGYKIGLPVFLLVVYMLSEKYLPAQKNVFLGFFLVSLGWTLDYYLTGKIKFSLSLVNEELSGLAITMVISTLMVSIPVIAGWLISGHKLAEIFLNRGSGLQGVGTGLAGLVLFGGLGVQQALSQGLELKVVAMAIPLALLFSLANGFREELTYRAALLKGFQANIGNLATILVTTLVFTVAHVDVSYIPPDQIVFVIGLILIGIVGSLIMIRTGSLLGSVLFHAGADVMLVLGLLSSQQLIL